MIKHKPKNKKCVLAISFSNYITTIGGMSKYMLAHEKMYMDAGYSYMSIYFVKKILKKKYPIFHFYGFIVDGKKIGVFTIDEILLYFNNLQKEGYTINDIHIHNISYMNGNHMIRLADTLPITPYKLILHDFHTICTQFNLLRNGVEYCGGKEMSAKKCVGCKYYEYGKDYVANIKKVLYNVKKRLTVVAPSEIAGQIWKEAYPEFKNQVIVITEQLWQGEYQGNREQLDDTKQIVIGYLGNKSLHKGWVQWSRFVEKASRVHDRYKCIVFNSKRNFDNTNMEHCPVRFKRGDLNAMITVLRKEKIDCAILWSICPETYSYTLFEACSANAFILTNTNSGNIAYTVQKKGNGLVLNSEDELYYYAEHPEKLALKINEARKKNILGPEKLVDNVEFLNLTDRSQSFDVKYKAANPVYRMEQKAMLKVLMCFSHFLKTNN